MLYSPCFARGCNVISYLKRHIFHSYLMDHDSPTFKLNILEEHWNITNYRATLAHKANHSFRRFNSKFISVIHPRHGPIAAIQSLRRINKGEEILVNYGYSEDGFVSNWYANAYKNELKMSWPGKYTYDENDKESLIPYS